VGAENVRVGTEVSRRDNMRALWEKAVLQSIDTRVIHIPIR
jgi:hypothetical protein